MIITAQQLKQLIDESANIVVIDVSNKTESFSTGRDVYEHSHIPGAVFLDVKKDLTGDDSFVPNPNQLAKKLGELGISNDNKIVLYDEGKNRHVSKAYLVLSYLGHKDISILQGGFKAWREAGNPVSAEISTRQPKTYTPHPDESIILQMDDIKKRMDDTSSILIDSRAHDRYTGKKEPKYQKAGHIPGAKNYFSRDVLQEDSWKDEAELKSHFENIENNKEVIVSCGSGNSACLNFVALKAAGYDDVKIYPGGFSEWISHDENEVATEEE